MSPQQDKLKQLGNTLVQKQEYEQAANFYDRALELDSTSEASAAIFSNRSLCFLNTKRFDEALQDAERVISLRPTWHRGYQRAAAACEKLTNKDQEGLKYLEKCFELDEASKTDSVFKKMKDDFEINIIKEKASSMTQDELKQAGNNYIKNQQYQQAIDIYTLAIEKNAFCDEAVPILSNRSMAYFKIGKFKEAYEDGGCCCGIKPDWAKGFFRRGIAAEQLQEWQIALESYDEYLKLDPQDEMGVAPNRRFVENEAMKEKQREEKEKQELLQIEKGISESKDPEICLAKSCSVMVAAGLEMNLNKMKMCMKFNPRIETPFFVNDLSRKDYQAFVPSATKMARSELSTNPYAALDVRVRNIAQVCFTSFKQQRHLPIAYQVKYLDYLLDLAEEQKLVSNASGVGSMALSISGICFHEPGFPVRKDLIFVLLDRIDLTKKLFLGAKATNEEFATTVLSCIFFGFAKMPTNAAEVKQHYEKDSGFQDVCTQDELEVIHSALKAGANPAHVQSSVPGMQATNFSVTPLNDAIIHLRSVKVVELLLRHGANVNEEKENGGRVLHTMLNNADTLPLVDSGSTALKSTPLMSAFFVFRPDIARTLLSSGGKLPVEKMPDFVVERFTPKNHPLFSKNYCSQVLYVFMNHGRRHLEDQISEEFLQLLFEAMGNQKFSFLCFDPSSNNVMTPLVMSLSQFGDLRIIRIMLRLKPQLATMMCMPSPMYKNLWMTPLGFLIQMACTGKVPNFEYLESVASLLIEHGASYKNDIVYRDIDAKLEKNAKWLIDQRLRERQSSHLIELQKFLENNK